MMQHLARLVLAALPLAFLACVPAGQPVGIVSSTGPSPVGSPPPPPSVPYATLAPNAKGPYAVAEVIDGDTFKIDLAGGQLETVRLIGVDTPETVHPTKAVQCYGPDATKYAREMLAGQRVRLAEDPTQGARDRYGRMLVYAWTDNGNILVNEALVANGYGREYTYDRAYEHQGRFRTAQASAKATKIGLWGACPDAEAWAAGATDGEATPSAEPSLLTAGPDPMASHAPVNGTPGSAPNPTASAPEPGSKPTVTGEAQPSDCGPNETYVRGYTKSDGTYVRAHCRKKPGT